MLTLQSTKSMLVFAGAMMFSVVSLPAENEEYDSKSYTWHPELSKEGPVLVAVSLKSQTAAVYRNGIKIGSCKVSTGRAGYKSPTGVFHILNKDAHHHSKKYGNAPMLYSERLTWDGVALHAGGLPGYPSSHGCIHLPYEFSKKLFSITHKGTTVVVTDAEPDVHVSSRHVLELRSGERTQFIWQPELSPAGPVSILFSRADKRIYVVRNGVTIGECPVQTSFFSKHPAGTSAYVFMGWKVNSKKRTAEAHWIKVGGPKGSHETTMRKWFKLDPRFQHLLEALIVPGTNLVVTSDSITSETRSDPGFRVLQGRSEEVAETE